MRTAIPEEVAVPLIISEPAPCAELKIDGGLPSFGKLVSVLPNIKVSEVPSDSETDTSDDNDSVTVVQDFPVADRLSTKEYSINNTTGTTIAFAFDIDGVLVRSKNPIKGARETLLKLQSLHIPFILLTNGGGLTEEAHTARVEQRLDVKLDTAQFVQSHTPFLDLVDQFHDKTVLALGGVGQNIRDVALAYGFNNVIISSDIMAEQSSVHPFPEMTKAHHSEHGRLADARGHNDAKGIRVSAIMVFSSPRDWCLDLQVVTDLLLSINGVMGTRSPKNGDVTLPNNGYLQDGQPRLFFCNPDFEWATSHNQPRFAQGAFREALKGIWSYATKGAANLDYEIVGKPTDKTYAYGERALQGYNERLAIELQEAGVTAETSSYNAATTSASSSQTSSATEAKDYFSAAHGTATGGIPHHRQISTVYMIGDNCESDIVGANSYTSRFGSEWKSILVETGVYESGTKPSQQPNHIAKDVASAVDWALAQHEVRQ